MPQNRIDCIIAGTSFNDVNSKHIFSNQEMLGPEYIAASLKYHNFSVEYMNAYSQNITEKEILERIISMRPYVVGVVCASQRSYPFVREFVNHLRESNYYGKIILGGFYASLEYRNILFDLKNADIISIGEGENSFVKLVDNIIHNIPINNIDGVAFRDGTDIVYNKPVRINNLDFDFFPVRTPIRCNAVSNMIDGNYIKGKYYNMIVGRGCYGRCSFCSICQDQKRRVRIYRSPTNIADEIFELLQMGINHIWFNDEIFYERSEKGRLWLTMFCNEIKSRNFNFTFNIEMRANDIDYDELKMLKEIGLTAIFVGIESGNQRILNEMRKDTTVEQNIKAIKVLENLDIHLEMGWISLLPTMSFQELKENYNFLLSTNCYTEENIYNKFNLYSGCYYENILKEKGLLTKRNTFYDRFGYTFLDPKVGVFTELIDGIRGEYKTVKKLTMRIQESASQNGDYSKYLYIRMKQREIWTYTILELVDLFDDTNINTYNEFKKTELYKKIMEQIKKLENLIFEL